MTQQCGRPKSVDPNTPSYDVNIYDDDVIQDQHRHFAAMRELGPVVWLPKHGNFAITRYAELSEALRNWQVFSSAKGVAGDDFGCEFSQGGTLTSDPELHDQLRKISVAPLRPSALDSKRAIIQAEAANVIDALVERGSFDGMKDFASHLPVKLVTDFVGFPEEGRENMPAWASAAFDILGCQNARGQAGVEKSKEMRKWLVDNVRPETMKPGSWSANLSELGASGKIPQEWVAIIMRDYVGPSLDTTISASGQLIYQLGLHPDQWRKLKDDPSLIPNAVQEAVRLASPVRSFSRTVTQDYELGGVMLPKGARVMMLYASANYDERHFHNPEQFDVTRANSGHLGFGTGIHICEGQHLAVLEMQSLLQAMVTRVDTIEVGEPTLALNNTIYSFATLPVRFTKAKSRTISRPAAVQDGWVDAYISKRSDAALDIVSLTLEANDGGLLPEYEAGAHIDVKLGNGLIRQYSLCTAPEDRGRRYRLGILNDPNSRGGSQWIHSDLRENTRIQISEPRNLFPLQADHNKSVLFAGGIGITPILAMAYALKEADRAFSLHYTARELSRAAFVDEMRAAFADNLFMYADDAQGAPPLDLPRILAAANTNQHIYCCGPGGFIDYVMAEAKKAGWPESHLHFERFAGGEIDTSGAFTVYAKKSGVEINVADGTTILQAVLDAGIDVSFACESGFCETCACTVLEGVPDHHDTFQTDEEKAENKRIAICCSRSKSEKLVLDI